jgi:RNA polymerase sigma factor (sigma-70 family)
VRGIARNVARDAIKKARRTVYMPSDQLIQAIDRIYESQNRRQRVKVHKRLQFLYECLRRVSSRHWEMLELRYRMGSSLKDIAAKMNRSEKAVQVSLTRIRQFLLRCIKQEAPEVTV